MRDVFKRLLLLGVLVWSTFLFAAPNLQKAKKVESISRSDFLGVKSVEWGTVPCKMFFKDSGDYSCDWCGYAYTGSWGFKKGSLWITESSRPEDPESWQTYEIKMTSKSLGILVSSNNMEIIFSSPVAGDWPLPPL